MSLPLVLKASYSVMAIAVLSLMWLYVRGLTSKQRIPSIIKVPFYGWIGFLTTIAILFHFLTAWQLPWVHWEFKRSRIKPDKEIAISVKENQFRLSEQVLNIKAGEIVKFTILSEDLTYGFGVFRENGTMAFQMQVLPGHLNEIIWVFSKQGKYSIRCTEYAGPETWKMVMKDAIEVSGGLKLAENKDAKQRRYIFD